MRNIAEILEDDRNGKQLSQTERQIAVAYIQGKYDAVKELKIGNNSNINEVLNKISVEISTQNRMHMDGDLYIKVSECMQIINKYKESEE